MDSKQKRQAYLEEKLGMPMGDDVVIEDGFREDLKDCDFAILFEDGKTLIYAPLFSFFKKALVEHLKDGELKRETKCTTDKVYYSDFGAVGDGVTEDIDALRKTHEYANASKRHKVCVDRCGKYYIRETGGKPIEIATDCHFEGAEFIIDDRFIDNTDLTRVERASNIFLLVPEYRVVYTKDDDPLGLVKKINDRGGIKTDDATLPFDLGFDALVGLVNTEKTMYKRWDPYYKTTGKGGPQQEVVVIRKDNTIDPETKPLFAYEGIDKLIISKCDTAPITIRGGRFVTIATRCDIHWGGLSRGFRIERSNVTIDGMDHYVDNQPLGEPLWKKLDGYERLIPVSDGGGPNYVNGWISPYMAHNLVVENSKLCGHVHYNNGSYDIGGSMTNKSIFKNCTQYNMYDENGKLYSEIFAYWGIHGTNYCKNIEFIDCTFSRFDAHAGVYNVKISGCTLGKINTVGGGTLTVENTTVHMAHVVGLRVDYATSWRGDMIFKNVTIDTQGEQVPHVRLVSGSIQNADYGFDTAVPSVIVDNVKWTPDCKPDNFYVYTLWRQDTFDDENEPKFNHIIPADRVIIRNQSEDFPITAISIDPRDDLYKEVIYE